MIQRCWGKEVEVLVLVLVQQAAVFFCTITCSIIVLWITSIAGDNRQAAKRSSWHRTPAALWETVWIISCLPADCLWGVWLGQSCVGRGLGVSVLWLSPAYSTSKMTSVSHSRWPYSFFVAWFKFPLKVRSQMYTFDRRAIFFGFQWPRWKALRAEAVASTRLWLFLLQHSP